MKEVDQILKEFVEKLNSSKIITESSEELKKKVQEIQDEVKEEVKDDVNQPRDVEKFLSKNKSKYQQTLNKCTNSKQKNVLKTVWEYTWYAVKQGTLFIIKHWDKILKLIFILALAFFSYKLYLFLTGTIDEYIISGDKIDKANRAAGGLGGWSCAGLGGGLR